MVLHYYGQVAWLYVVVDAGAPLRGRHGIVPLSYQRGLPLRKITEVCDGFPHRLESNGGNFAAVFCSVAVYPGLFAYAK